jgi:hypothetical protein
MLHIRLKSFKYHRNQPQATLAMWLTVQAVDHDSDQ